MDFCTLCFTFLCLENSQQVEVEASRVHVRLHVCSSQPSLKRRDGRGAPGSGGPGGRRQDAVQVRQAGGEKRGREGLSGCFPTASCHSRAEFLSLLKNYNYFLKEQTQLHLSYAQVRLCVSYLNLDQCCSAQVSTVTQSRQRDVSCL